MKHGISGSILRFLEQTMRVTNCLMFIKALIGSVYSSLNLQCFSAQMRLNAPSPAMRDYIQYINLGFSNINQMQM